MTETLLEGLGLLGQGLSYPGDMVRGVLAGRAGERVTGHQLLQQLGMDPGDDWMGTGAGIGVDIATDPLTYAGGALIKGLGGVLGKARKARATPGTPEWDRANVFDLPGDPAAMARDENLALIDNAFPVPVKPPPAPEASPLAAAVAEPDVPLPMLAAVPKIDDYGFGRAYAPYYRGANYAKPSPVDDMVAEGSLADALQANLGQWDAVIDDLRRLPPNSGQAFRSEGWPSVIEGRVGDLRALTDVGLLGRVVPRDLADTAVGQLERLGLMFPDEAGRAVNPQLTSRIFRAAQEIDRGLHPPSSVVEALAGPGRALGHLPLNEAELRRAAATGQAGDLTAAFDRAADRANRAIPEGLSMEDLLRPGPLPGNHMPAYAAELGGEGYPLDAVRDDVINALTAAFGSKRWVNNYEPSVARSVLGPGGPRGAEYERGRELLRQLRAARGRPVVDPVLARAAAGEGELDDAIRGIGEILYPGRPPAEF